MAEEQQVGQRSRQLRKLTEISRALTYAVSIEEVLELSVDCAATLLEAPAVVLMMHDENEVLRIRAARGISMDQQDAFEGPLHETLISRLRTLLGIGEGTRFLGVPLVVSGNVTGLLGVKCAQLEEDAFDEEEWLLSALADQAAVALEKTRLDKSSEFRERLIGIVSHDLRNPIAAIAMTAASMLHRDHLDDYNMRSLVRIQSAAGRAQRMICDLLDFTQARLGGGIKLERTKCRLTTLVEEMSEELLAAHPERNITITQTGSDMGCWDGERVKQAVGNLLANAIQYSDSDTAIEVRIQSDSRAVTTSVRNAGSVIPAEKMSRLFEPMHRAVQHLTRGERSVGLGLYIVKHIAEAHGGEVSVESTDGAGTTFSIRLPL